MSRANNHSGKRSVECTQLESRRLLALANLFTDTTLRAEYVLPSDPVLHADVNGDGIADLVAPSHNSGLWAHIGNGNGTFQPEMSLQANTLPRPDDIVVADFNSDGRDDFLSYEYSLPSRASINLSDVALTYTSAPVALSSGTQQVIAADVNGDDSPDLIAVVRGSNQSHPLQLLLNHGDGTFASPVELAASTVAFFVAAADVNDDGNTDLVVNGAQAVSPTNAGVGVLLSRGDGTFENTVWQSGEVGEVFLGNANGDDHLDILQTNGLWTDVRFGDGTGSFSSPVRSNSSQGSRTFVDFNNDGNDDLIASDASIVLRLALGDGTFGAPITLKSNSSRSEFTATDLNADGNVDIVYVTNSPYSLTILFGDGDRAIQQLPTGPIPGSSFSPAVADFNDDGLDDLVSLGSPTEKRLFVALKLPGTGYASPLVIDTGSTFSPSAFLPGDFTGDGNVDVLVSHFGIMTLLAGHGDGTFALAGTPGPISLGQTSVTSIAVDFDADGADDIVARGNGTSLYRSNRDGTFTRTSLTPGQTSISIASRDIDANGVSDVAAIMDDGSVLVLLGQSGGTFVSSPVMPGVAASVIYLGKFDADDAIDMVIHGGSTLQFRRGDGRGGFGAPAITSFSNGLRNAVIADIDDDGLDEVIANYDPPVVFDLRADGTFAPKTPIDTSDSNTRNNMLVTDFNNDGRLDVATSGGGFQVSPTFNLNVGQTLPPSALSSVFDVDTRAVEFRFDAVLSADSLDVSDLIVTRVDGAVIKLTADSADLVNGGRTVRFLLPNLADGDYRFSLAAGAVVSDTGLASTSAASVTSFILAGDANRDRTVNFDDLLILAQNYGQAGKTFSQGNFNYSPDGTVDFDDLLILAQRYGTSLAIAKPLAPVAKRRGANTDILN